MYYLCIRNRGSSSVGRALASQAKGRGFESRLPLVVKKSSYVKRDCFFCIWLLGDRSWGNYCLSPKNILLETSNKVPSVWLTNSGAYRHWIVEMPLA